MQVRQLKTSKVQKNRVIDRRELPEFKHKSNMAKISVEEFEPPQTQ